MAYRNNQGWRDYPQGVVGTMVAETDEHIDFSMHLVPTSDFVMHLLQMGALVELLEPQSLRNEMKKWIGEMYAYYI